MDTADKIFAGNTFPEIICQLDFQDRNSSFKNPNVPVTFLTMSPKFSQVKTKDC